VELLGVGDTRLERPKESVRDLFVVKPGQGGQKRGWSESLPLSITRSRASPLGRFCQRSRALWHGLGSEPLSSTAPGSLADGGQDGIG
jgi:hypothetical protein